MTIRDQCKGYSHDVLVLLDEACSICRQPWGEHPTPKEWFEGNHEDPRTELLHHAEAVELSARMLLALGSKHADKVFEAAGLVRQAAMSLPVMPKGKSLEWKP